VTHLHCNCVRTPVHIRRGEPKQAKSRADEAILAAVVLHHPISVIATVEFNGQTLNAIKQVLSA
jgi:hypothetical protein